MVAYREPQAIGSPRAVDTSGFAALQAAGALFHAYDEDQGRPVGVPRTPCPVLAGFRGRDPDLLVDAASRALAVPGTEQVDGWLLFATNQESGDHVAPIGALAEAPPWATVRLDAAVAGMPRRIAGGHVFVGLVDAGGAGFEAAAFEPTHALRDAAGRLRPGDEVTVVGALEDGVVRLEAFGVRRLAASVGARENPLCPACGRRMPSMGAGAGHRCRACGARAPAGSAVEKPEVRTVALGWHEASVMARRHLHRPAAWDAPRGTAGS